MKHHQRLPVPKGAEGPDPVLQSSAGPLVATTTGLTFAGVGNGDYGFVPNAAPPDTNGTVGATQYVQWVNESFAVFDKSTGSKLMGPTAGNTLWSGFGGPCETNNDGDPIAQYDKAANRWVLTQFSVTGGPPFFQCVAVSTTSDATGSYNRYSFQQPNFNDYPKLGVWPDGYYVSFNMFSGNVFVGGRACAFDRSAMLAGAAATQVCFQLSSSFGGLLPSDLDGTAAPPAGSPDFFLNFGANSLNLWKFHVDFATPANSTFTGPTNISVATFSAACNGGGTCIPQSGTSEKLDSLADRLMYRLAYRNFGSHESLVVNHSVTAGTSVGVRWYELQSPNGTPTVAQQGTFAPDSNYRWMGSIAMDQAGDIAVGYSVSSSSMFPAVRYTGRAPGDASGTLQAENSLIEGGGSQLRNLNRWGDYSAMTVDPVDDCTFWYTNEYLKSSGTFNWSTRIGSFKFSGCPLNEFGIQLSPTSGAVTAGSTATYTVQTSVVRGSAESITLAAPTGLPAGVSGAYSVNPVLAGASSTLTLTAAPSAAPSPATTFTVTGTSPSVQGGHSATASVNVAAPPAVAISAPANGANVSGTTTVTATATAASGTSLSTLVIKIDGTQVASGSASPLNYSWNTAALVDGSTHAIAATATDADGGTATSATVMVTVHSVPCYAVTLASSPPSPQASGTSITLTGSATCTTGTTAAYRFWIVSPATGWSLARDWNTSSTMTWTTTGLANGVYGFLVETRAQGGTAATASAWQDFQLGSCPAVALGVSPMSPRPPGTSITLTANPACTNPGTTQYRFWINSPTTGLSLLRDWGTSTTATWATTGLADGVYKLTVDMGTQGSSAVDASAWQQFLLRSCSAVSLAASPASPQTVGTSIALTASATCAAGITPEYRFWINSPTAGWSIGRDWGTSSAWTWTTAGLAAGSYGIQSDVRSQGSTHPEAFSDAQSFVLTP